MSTSCQALRANPPHVIVFRTPGGDYGFLGENADPVSGQSVLDRGEIWLGLPDPQANTAEGLPLSSGGEAWKMSAMTHELGHWLDDKLDHRIDYQHASWTKRGLFEAIHDAQRTY